jgi:hypothetical protein
MSITVRDEAEASTEGNHNLTGILTVLSPMNERFVECCFVILPCSRLNWRAILEVSTLAKHLGLNMFS